MSMASCIAMRVYYALVGVYERTSQLGRCTTMVCAAPSRPAVFVPVTSVHADIGMAYLHLHTIIYCTG